MTITEKGKWYVLEKDYISPEGQMFRAGDVSQCDADNTLTSKTGKKGFINCRFLVHEWTKKDLCEGMAIAVEQKSGGKYVGNYMLTEPEDVQIQFMSVVTPKGEYKTYEHVNIEDATVRPATMEEIVIISNAMNEDLKKLTLDNEAEGSVLDKLFQHKEDMINPNTGWFVCTQDYNEEGQSFRVGAAYNLSTDGYKWFLIDNNGTEVEINPHILNTNFKPWTIKDVKFGDILAEEFLDGTQFIMVVEKLRELPWSYELSSICHIARDGEFVNAGRIHAFKNMHPATQEQEKLMHDAMEKNGFEIPQKPSDYEEVKKSPEFKKFAEKMDMAFCYAHYLSKDKMKDYAYNKALEFWLYLRDVFKK